MDIIKLHTELLGDTKPISKEESYSVAVNLMDHVNLDDFLNGDFKKREFSHKFNEVFRYLVLINSNILNLIIQELKRIIKPCFKSDTLIGIVHHVLFDGDSMERIIHRACSDSSVNIETQNKFCTTMVSLCENIANKQGLRHYQEFTPKRFYEHLVNAIYNTTCKIFKKEEIDNFKIDIVGQILGRIAICGHSDIVWEAFTKKVLSNERPSIEIQLSILRLPLVDIDMERYMEPLYLPIFHNIIPSNSKQTIGTLLQDSIVDSHSLRFLLCNKLLLTSHSKSHIATIFNIFNYLSNLQVKKENVLLETFMTILMSWSDYNNVKLRSQTHNHYISCVVVIGFRYLLANKELLTPKMMEIESLLMSGVTSYLKCVTPEYRNLGICVAELLIPHVKGSEQLPNLEFGIKLDEDAILIKGFFEKEIDDLFSASETCDKNSTAFEAKNTLKSESNLNEPIIEDPPEELDSDDDCEFDAYDFDAALETKKFDTGAPPIYPRDCIAGLAENEKPETVTHCIDSALKIIRLNSDTIDDCAVEFTKVLLYLDDHFSIDNFLLKRLEAMSALCTICPQLVGGYLIDEFNSKNHNTRHRLDILEVLVSSANQLAEGDSIFQIPKELPQNMCRHIDTADNLLLKSFESSIIGDLQPLLLSNDSRKEIHRMQIEQRIKANTRIIHPKRQPATMKINKFAKHSGLFFYGLLNSLFDESKKKSSTHLSSLVLDNIELKPKSSTLDISLSKVTEDVNSSGEHENTYLVARTLFSLALILRCVPKLPITLRMSMNLLEVIGSYKYHVEPMIRKGVLFCLSNVITCTPANQLSDLHGVLVEFVPWLMQLISFDRNDDCCRQAEELVKFLDNYSSVKSNSITNNDT